MKKLIVIVVLLFILPALTHAQSGKLYSTENNLSNSLINKIHQDKKGFVWIATEYGLNKFDGQKFTVYNNIVNDSTSLKNNYVRTIFDDGNGNFWIGTINGLMKYDDANNSFSEVKIYKNNRLVYPHITCIIKIANGDIWFTTSGQGLFTINKGDTAAFFHSELSTALNSTFLNLIYQDSKKNIWIGTENDGLHLYNPSTGKLDTFNQINLNSNNISAITEDNNGNVFVGTLTNGLNVYNYKKNRFEPIRYEKNTDLFIKSLLFTKQQLLLIGTDGQGLKLYNKDQNLIEDFEINSVPFDFSKGKIHSILQDKDNNIWLGMFQKGIVFIPSTENKFEYYGYKSLKNNTIGSSCVTAICKDNLGVIWIGTDNDGIYGINEKGKRIAHFFQTNSPKSVPDIILNIHCDSNNDLWIGSYTKGLAKMNRQNGICEYIPELINKKVYSIREDKNKNLLIGTHGTGFYIISPKGEKIHHYESSKTDNENPQIDELINDWINCLIVDKEGLIWIGHYKGLSCFDPDRKTFLTFFDKNNFLPGKIVISLYEDRDGKIWIGSTQGLYMFDKKSKSISNLDTKNDLANSVICGISEDTKNNIWISTYKGISKYIIDEKRFINYYNGDGLQGNEFTRGAVFRDDKGKIFFGGTNGITAFYPNDITDTKKELKIFITDFYVSNKSIKKGDLSGGTPIVSKAVIEADTFRLSYNDNTFSIDFSTLEFSNPDRISYEYMIEGINSSWMTTNAGVNRITYNNLNPGIYLFKVRAIDNENHSIIKTIHIIISPPWYKTWWALICYSILFVLLAYGITSYIISQVKHRQEILNKEHSEAINEAKLQFFINISHEIRTPMTLIMNPLEKLLKEKDNPERHKTYLMIYRNAQRILRLINQLMDIRKLDKGQMQLRYRATDMVSFINDLMLTFENLAQKKNIDFTFDHQSTELEVWIDLHNFDKILLNILSNAFKYTSENGEIKIKLASYDGYDPKGSLKNYFEITVTDSGIGIDADKIEKIFERFYQINNDHTVSNFGTGIGLHLSRLLVELHHGIIFAENREDKAGSRFVIRLPLGKDHLSENQLENKEDKNSQVKIRPLISEMAGVSTINETSKTSKKSPTKTRYKILIVEDEDEIRDYINNELSADYRISTCSNGKEALNYVLKEKIDLIISDVMMPKMDGITLCKKIKHNINISHIPIILLTAKSKTEDKIEGLDIGADAYLTKPFNTDILIGTINNLIANTERLKNKFSGNERQEDKVQDIVIKSSDELLMNRIMKVINENISNCDLNVEMLAKNVGMSRVHMHRKLKELTSQSARDFIKGIRLNQAANLLVSKKLSISEVAYATGFSNLSHFSNSFKEFYGASPTDYINKNNFTDTNNSSKTE